MFEYYFFVEMLLYRKHMKANRTVYNKPNRGKASLIQAVESLMPMNRISHAARFYMQ